MIIMGIWMKEQGTKHEEDNLQLALHGWLALIDLSLFSLHVHVWWLG